MSNEQIYKIAEVVEYFSVEKIFIKQCIEKEWVDLVEPDTQKLDQEDVSRIIFIQELKEKRGVNDEAIPIILHLVDQLHYLQLQVKKRVWD